MAFEVKATHRLTDTGELACEIHPDVFVDVTGRVFSIRKDATGTKDGVPIAVTSLDTAEDAHVFVVEDEAVEVAADWILMLACDPPAEDRITRRARCRWPLPSGSVTDVFPDPLPGRDERVVEFEVRASHRLRALRMPACEIYPDVFVAPPERVATRLAGMARQLPEDIVTVLPPDEQHWIRIQLTYWVLLPIVSSAHSRDRLWLEQHGGDTFFRFEILPVGPMGPACPPRGHLPH